MKYKNGCNTREKNTISFVFPKDKRTKISLTKNIDKQISPVVFKLFHTNNLAKVYWYLNDKFIKTTNNFHEIAVKPKKGIYTLTVIDDFGNEVKKIVEFN